MDIEIKYCVTCGLGGRARRLAERIGRELGVAARLTPGRLGQFAVFADGSLVSGRKSGVLYCVTYTGFPDESEVVERLRRRMGQTQPSGR